MSSSRKHHPEPSPGAGHRVAVIGAGVIGLTSAIRLLERGFEVTLLSREAPHETTSQVAAAYWHPFAAAPRDRVLGWAHTTYRVCEELARDPASGVMFKTLYKLFRERRGRHLVDALGTRLQAHRRRPLWWRLL